MKRGKKLILLLLLLVAAVGAYFVVSKIAEEDNKKEVITAFSINSSDISSITWTYSGNDVTLIYDRSNEKWMYKDDDNFPVDETYPETMVSKLSNITADRMLTDVTDFSEYGLDDPTIVISIVDSNGGTTKFTIGDQNSNTSDYYMRINDESTVYLIGSEFPEAFFHELNDILTMEEIPYIYDASQISVETFGKTNTLVQLDEDERGNYSYTTRYAWYYKESEDSYKAIDGDMAEDIITAISGLSWKSCADYYATDEELETYGLKNPYATVTVDYTETTSSDSETQQKEFVLLIGNNTGDYYYAKLPDSNMVYLITSSVVDTFMNTNYAALRPKDVCLMDWSTVDSMDVTIDGKTTTIVFSRSEDSTTAATYTYTIDGNEVDSEKVVAFLTSISGLTSDNSIDNGTYSESGDVVIVFHRNTENYNTMTLAFSQYDSSYYLASFNGEARLLVSNEDLQNIVSSFNSIQK